MARAAMLLALLLGGCSLTGRSTTQTISVRAAERAHPHLALTPVAMEAKQTRLVAVGSYAWGTYDLDDLTALDSSLRETARVYEGAAPHRVLVVVRRALVSHTNNEGFLIACVAWALVRPDGSRAFDEQFYAARHATLSTLGNVKDAVHEAIVRRVIGTALNVASGEASVVHAHDTYDTFERASREVPTTFHPTLTAAPGPSHASWARVEGAFDWDSYLASDK